MSTLFEKIINRKIPSDILHEDGSCIVIKDVSPQAPFHALVIPKKPIPRIRMAEKEDQSLLGHLLLTAAQVAQRENLDDGFRIVAKQRKGRRRKRSHLHVHLLGGRRVTWPPG